MPARRINEIVHGNRAITADTTLRLEAYFRTHAQNWINLQTHHDTVLRRAAMLETLAG